jgi:hypothetical protein
MPFGEDAGNDGSEQGTGGGGQLREKLEESIAANKVLTEKLSSFEAREFLDAHKDFSLVKAEDLKGVADRDREAKASEIQQERQRQQEELLRDVLVRQGLSGDDLEEALAEFVADKTADTEDADKARRMRTAGNVDASRAPRVDVSKLEGFDAIRAGLDAKSKPRSRT